MPKPLADRAVAAAWLGRSGHLPATLLAKGWEKCKVQSEAKTAVLKSSLMMRWARVQSQQSKWPQLTHGLRHGLPVSGRSSENSENEAASNANRSELRERRKHVVAKSSLFGPNLWLYGTLTGGMDAVGRGTKPILCSLRAASIITKVTKRITRPRIKKRLQYL